MPAHSCTISVNAAVKTVYAMWSNFEDYPRLLSYVRRVERIDETRSLWHVEMLGSYQNEVASEGSTEYQRIAWRSVRGPQNSGSILFEADPTHPGTTLLTLDVTVDPPEGTAHVAAAAAAAQAAFEAQLRDDLEAFAEAVEALAMGRRARRKPSIVRGTDRSEAAALDPLS